MKLFFFIAVLSVLLACSNKPLVEFSPDTEPLMLLPASLAGIEDGRGRFREIYCTLEALRGDTLPDDRPCEKLLVALDGESESSRGDVATGAAQKPYTVAFVPGLGWQCLENYIDPDGSIQNHLARFGYGFLTLEVDGLSSSKHNAVQLRDSIMAMELKEGDRPLILLGYSKGVPDILLALVEFPEIRGRVAAVVSVAGSVGGSPLANTTSQSTANLLRFVPGSDCDKGDSGAVQSMMQEVRRQWLAENPLPEEIPYYSLVTYPDPDNISEILHSNYRTVSKIDGRNDSQLIFYDQLVPGSVLLGYVNADHWAVMVPIARSHKLVGATLVDKNAFPRELLLEAIVRYVEEDLAR